MYSFFGALIQNNCKTYLNTIIINGTPYLGLPCGKYRIRAIGVIRERKNITFAASTLKQKSYAERKSQLSGSLRSVSAVQ